MNNNEGLVQTTMETIQWFIFLLASSVAMPVVIGAIFQMDYAEIASLMQRTLFVVGVASFLQAWLGHKLPIMEGPAGIWISIFSVMAITGAYSGQSTVHTLESLEMAMILTGGFLFLFGVFRIAQKILPVFTPLVTGTFFLLLTVQLSGTFLQGMLGIQQDSTHIKLGATTIAFITFFIVLSLSIFGRGWLSSYAVLIGIVFGWILYVLAIGAEGVISDQVFGVPQWFAWGVPKFDLSLVPMALLIAIILLSNVVASVVAMNQSLGGKTAIDKIAIDRGSMFSGINHSLAGIFSSIANVPLATSSGFVSLTGQKRKAPFMYAALLLVIVAFFPIIVSFLSGIPSPIANAALMATFIQLVGLAIRNVAFEELDSRKVTIVGTAYLIGMGTLFLPTDVFVELPAIVQNLASNGLLIGTALVIILEQLWREPKKENIRVNKKA